MGASDAAPFLIGVCVAAGVVLVAGLLTRYRTSAAWLSLFLAGQAVWLGLVDAGHAVHFEHLRFVMSLRGGPPLSGLDLAVHGALILQAAIVIAGLIARRHDVRTWLGPLPLGPRTILFGAFLLFAAAFPSPAPATFALEAVVVLCWRLAQLGCAALVVLSLPPDALTRFGTTARRVMNGPDSSDGSRRLDRLVLYLAASVVIVAAALAWFSYERHPHIPDEVGYLFQARYFSEGHLAAPAPLVPEAFEAYLVDCTPAGCTSPFPPGWPALLAVGVLAGLPWLVNPLLAGLNVILAFLFARTLWGRPVARVSAMLIAVSPMHVFMGMSFMSHVFSLTCALVAALGVARMREGFGLSWGVVAGIAIGLISFIRPLEAAVVAAVLGLASIVPVKGRLRIAPVLVLASVTLVVSLANLPYNKAITGSATTFPVDAYMNAYLGEGNGTLGFGPNKGSTWKGFDPFPGHGLRDVVVNTQVNFASLNLELFGWAAGSLLGALWLLFTGQLRRSDWWLAGTVGAVAFAQAFYWFSGGSDFGARYWFITLVPLVVLTARALVGADARTTAAAAVLTLASLIVFVPWRAVDKYHGYRNMHPDVRNLLATQNFGTDILLIRGESNPDFASALPYSAMFPGDTSPLILHDRDAATRARIQSAYADRRFWIIDGPTRTGGGYRVAAGPVTATELSQVSR